MVRSTVTPLYISVVAHPLWGTHKTTIDRQPRKHRSLVSRSRRLIISLLAVLILLFAAQALRSGGSSAVHYTYQGGPHSFVGQLDSGQVKSVSIDLKAQTVAAEPTSGPPYTIGYPDIKLLSQLLAQDPQVAVAVTTGASSWWSGLLILLLPLALIVGFMVFMMRRMQGGGSKVMSFGKSRAKRVSADSPKVTFKDCLLYTSDAADEEDSVDLGGRRIIKK